jgi:ribose-phosphate pyrophosphokinase
MKGATGLPHVSSPLQLFTTDVAASMAGAVCGLLKTQLPIAVKTAVFGNGQMEVRFDEDVVCHSHVVLFQSFPDRVHDRLLEFLLALDLLRCKGAQQITAVLPYLPYSRSDRPAMRGGPVPSQFLGVLMTLAGMTRLVTLELHTPQLCGTFTCQVINIPFAPVVARYLVKAKVAETVVVSPDFGGAKRAESLAAALNVSVAIMRKHRHGEIRESIEILGDVENREIILIDDEFNSGQTSISAATRLKAAGAASVTLAVAHGMFTPSSRKNLQNSPIDKLIVSNSIPRSEHAPETVEYLDIWQEIAAALSLS